MIYCNGNNIIQSGDTLRFWAFVTDVNGGCLSNQDVVFYTVKDGVKTQIGSPVVTDSNGIAVCDYVGSGMGDIAIMAETEIDGTFVSEILQIFDCTKYDTGIEGTATNIYSSVSTNAMTRTSEYTSLKEVTGTTQVEANITVSSTCVMDFDYSVVDGAGSDGSLYIYKDSTLLMTITFSRMGYTSTSIGEWLNLRLTIDETSATITDLNDPTKTYTISDFSGTPNKIRFYTGGTISELRWKNIRIYPI